MEQQETLSSVLGNPPREAKRLIMMWLFGQTTHKYLLSQFEDAKYGRELTALAQASGYVNKCCKLYAYYYHCHGYASPDDFGVARQDTTLLKSLDLHFDVAIKPMTLRQFDRVTAKMLGSPHMQAYISKLVWRKMRWLQSFAYDIDELKAVLVTKALYGLAKQYPEFQSPLHFQNIAKRTIANEAKSIITAHTREKRRRFIQNEDGTNQSLVAPLEAVAEMEAPNTGLPTEVKESLLTIAQLAPGMSERVRKFIMCMCGHVCHEFSAFLGVDNSEAIDKMRYDTYRSRLEAHLGVTRHQTDRLLLRLRDQLV